MSVLTDSMARKSDTYTYETRTFWTYYGDDTCLEAYTLSTIDQKVYKITAFIKCKNSDSSVKTSDTAEKYNDTSCFQRR